MAVAKTGNKDKYCQLAVLSAVESAAGTIAFAKLQAGMNNMMNDKKYVMEINRIQYQISPAYTQLLLDDADYINMAITTSENLTTIDLMRVEVIDQALVSAWHYGTAASGQLLEQPITHDFAVQGGIIVPFENLYLAIQGISMAGVVGCKVRIWYRVVELGVAEYIDLIQALGVLTT